MKRSGLKRGIAFLMLLVMVICTIPVSDVSAAKTSSKTKTIVSEEKKVPALAASKGTVYLKGTYVSSYTIQINNLDKKAKVTYRSANKSVARVTKAGVINAKKVGKATINITVKQNGETYKLKFVCTVKKASITMKKSAAKESSAEEPVQLAADGKVKTGITLAGSEKVSVYSSTNKKNYNMKARVYDAKTGEALTKAKDSNNNPYVNISKTGILTAQGTPGDYYVKFESVPKGCSVKLYVSVSSEKTKKDPTPVPKVTETPAITPNPTAAPVDDTPAAPWGSDPTATPTPSGSDPTATPTPSGSDPTATPTPSGSDPTATPTPSGSDPTATPTPTLAPNECRLSFELADGCKQLSAELPDSRVYKVGDEIGKLPNAFIANGIFGGWYYDAAQTEPVKAADVIEGNTTVYGELRTTAEKQILDTPQYVIVTVPENQIDSFSFGIKGYEQGCIESFTNSSTGESVAYTVNTEKIIPVLEKGKTYTVKLTEDCTAAFVVNGEAKKPTAKEMTIETEREEVMNLSLADGIVYIPLKQVSKLDGVVFDGLFSIDVDNKGTSANKYEGSFNYSGDGVKVGDTVAIYEGQRPDERDFSVFDSDENIGVAYLTITGINGSTYSFKTADAKNVMKNTEVLPVSVDADKDGSSTNHSITVSKSVFDYSDSKYEKLGYDATTTVDEGDFILFYRGEFETAVFSSYAKVTKVTANGSELTVTYVDATDEEVFDSMDMYNKRETEIELSDDELNMVSRSIEQQAIESGFLDEAANYLVALALETDGFQELSDDLDLDISSYNVKLVDGTELSDEEAMQLMDGSEAKITKKDVHAHITPGYRLQMFEGDHSGLRIELAMSMTITIGEQDDKKDHIELVLTACFEEEILFDINLDGGAVWDYALIFPYIADYEVSANLDWGTAVCAGITATLKTVKGKEAPFDWKNTTGFDGEQSILDIGKQLTKLMSEKEQFMGETILDENGEEIEATSNAGGLVDKYKAFMEDAQKDECWITIVEKPIVETEGPIDPLGIIVYGLSLKFVVKMNMYLTVGATYESGEGTRYSFYMRIWDRYVKTSETPIMEPHVNYDFYVFGTLGIKVGLEFELGVGLFSLKLDSVGFTAEAGVYFTIAGYFYAHYTMTQKNGKIEEESSVSGALAMEIGFYIEIKFKAQAFSNNKLTYNPTLFEKSWPFWTLGEPENVIAFTELYEDDDIDKPSGEYEDYDDVVEIVWDVYKEFPEEYFTMEILDLFSGEADEKTFEGKDIEDRFTVKLDNNNFRFVPTQNTIYLTAARGTTDHEEADMTIIWDGAPLAFTTKPIERKIKIIWTDPVNARYISFNTQGGSYVKTIATPSGTGIEKPEDPTKKGYDFGGWYTKSSCPAGTEFTFPSEMPNYESGGMTVYAKWIPRNDTQYVVNHYKQNQAGKYVLDEAEFRKGTTDSTPTIDELKKSFDGYYLKTYSLYSIRPDGSTVITIYYALNNYKVSFSFGEMKDGSFATGDIVYTVKHGGTCIVPNMFVQGYVFEGYNGVTPDKNGCITVTGDASYEAKWAPANDTPYSIEQYVRVPGSPNYELYETYQGKGTTKTAIDPTVGKYTDSRFVYTKTEYANTDETAPIINAKGDSIIRFYYDRTTYKLSFMDGDTAVGSPADVEWGKNITKPADPAKKGYVFDAWYKDRECTAANLFDFEKDTMPAAAFTLYAGWKPSDQTAYTVEYYGQEADDANKYTYMGSDTFYGTTDKEVTGVYKEFDHFVKNESYSGTVSKAVVKADGTAVLKLYYNRATVKVSFNANGGTLGSDGASKTFRYGQTFSATAPTREDYGFEGWYIGDVKFTSTTVTAAEDFELEAHWKAGVVNYVAEHYVMGVDGQYPSTPAFKDNTLTGTLNDTVALADLKKSDLEVADGIVYDYAMADGSKQTTASVAKNMTVKLYYKRNSYALTWNLNGEVPTNNGAYSTGEVYYDAKIVAPEFAKTGYTYAFNPADIPAKMPASAQTISVSCKPISYTVVFNQNASDATGTMQNQSFDYDEKKALTTNAFSRTGYDFKGWSDSAEGTVVYSDAQEISNLTAENGKNVNLYAVWQGKEYTVNLNLNDNSAAFAKTEDNITVYSYGQTLTLPIPVMTGYRFKGWYVDALGTGDAIEKLTPEVATAETIVLYAKWEEAVYTISWDRNGKDADSSDVFALIGTKSFTGQHDKQYNVYLKDGYSIGGKHVDLGSYVYAYVYAPNDPTRESTVEYDYTFDGWYTEKIQDSTESQKSRDTYVPMFKNEGDEYADVEITGDVTYYAHWIKTPVKYTVHWYMNGRTETGKVATEADCIPATTGTGYLNTTIDLGVVYLKNHSNGARFTGDEDYVLNNYYTPGKAAYGTEIIAPACVDSDYDAPDAAHIFMGWYNVEDCETENDHSNIYIVKNPDAKPLELGEIVTKDVQYVAIWEDRQKDYVIAWNGNADDVTLNGDYTCKDGSGVAIGTPIIAPVPERASTLEAVYPFDGWYTESNGGVKLSDSETVKGDATYYAHWGYKSRYYSVKFMYMNGEGTKEVNVRYKQRIDAESDTDHKNISGSSLNEDGYNANYSAVLKAAYTDIGGKYEVGTYYPGSGTFRGWYVCNAEGSPIDADGTVVDSIDKACTWEAYYEGKNPETQQSNRIITSDIIVKAKWDYDFWVLGTQLTSYWDKNANILSNIYASNVISGCIYYDSDTKTLTFNKLCINLNSNDTNYVKYGDNIYSPILYNVTGGTEKLKINLVGASVITVIGKNGESVSGISSFGPGLEIIGDGCLDIYTRQNTFDTSANNYGIYIPNGDYVQKGSSTLDNQGSSVHIVVGTDYDNFLKTGWDDKTEIPMYVSDRANSSTGIKANNAYLDCSAGYGQLLVYAAVDQLGYGIDGNMILSGSMDNIAAYVYGHRAIKGGGANFSNVGKCSCSADCKLNGKRYTEIDGWQFTYGTDTCNYFFYCKEIRDKLSHYDENAKTYIGTEIWNIEDSMKDFIKVYYTQKDSTSWKKKYADMQ